MKTNKVVRVNERQEIVTGQRHCYLSRAAALRASQGATTEPRVITLWDRAANRDYFLGVGEQDAATRTVSHWGKGGIVRMVDVGWTVAGRLPRKRCRPTTSMS